MKIDEIKDLTEWMREQGVERFAYSPKMGLRVDFLATHKARPRLQSISDAAKPERQQQDNQTERELWHGMDIDTLLHSAS